MSRVKYGDCRHCNRVRRLVSRGLCWLCNEDPDIRARYCKLSSLEAYMEREDQTTEEELEAMIAEQMAKLPAWFWRDTMKEGGPRSAPAAVRNMVCQSDRAWNGKRNYL